MEGTISMGIYDGKGKLVRALHREEEVQSDAFGKALNGLITSWDGKNDAGELMPADKYFARGFMVGDIAAEGEAMHGNDWITDDNTPRLSRITDLFGMPHGFGVSAQISGSTGTLLSFDASGNPIANSGGFDENIVVRDGKIVRLKGASASELALPSVVHAIAASPSRDGGAWIIDQSGTNCEVKEFTTAGEFQRRLQITDIDFKPVKIAASVTDDEIFLLLESSTAQKLRALSLVATGTATATGTEQATSTWKVAFEKTITFSDTLEQARGLLKLPDGKPFESQDKIKVFLLPNPMVQDQLGSLEISAGIDARGSYLKTSDGLLLKRISDTPNLKWAAIGRDTGSKIIVLFQSDGAVVEEYHITHSANMMAFDCGDFDFDPAKLK